MYNFDLLKEHWSTNLKVVHRNSVVHRNLIDLAPQNLDRKSTDFINSLQRQKWTIWIQI